MNEMREKAILSYLLQQPRVTVKELARRLYASEPSIRRDLASLEARNLIKRVHGGAVLEETALSKNKIPFTLRQMEQSEEKDMIASLAAAKVEDNDVIFLDASSSAYSLIPYLLTKNGLTVITNGVRALSLLTEYGIRVISTGGEAIPSCMALTGNDACTTIRNYYADKCFFSCRGFSNEGEASDISVEESLVRREMIARSKENYLLCSSAKLGKQYYYTICRKQDITEIITIRGKLTV